MNTKPNIVLIVADNLGWGELGCYGGGKMMRGAATPRIDALAECGMRLLNYNVESDCVPTRGALMTGRHPIRTGAFQSIPPGLPQGLKRSEWTLAEMASEAGYATAHFGKWHLGDVDGRFPSESHAQLMKRNSRAQSDLTQTSPRYLTLWRARKASRR
jgi:arylsulfatase